MKRIISLFCVFALILSLSNVALAAESTATLLRLESTEGTVTVVNAAGRTLKNKDGMRLLNGYTIKTAAASYAYVSLDSTKAVKLDALTSCTVKKQGKNLELLLNTGKLFFNVTEHLEPDASLTIRTSTMATGIRGTSGTVWSDGATLSITRLHTGTVTVTTPEGTGDLNAFEDLQTAVITAGEQATSSYHADSDSTKLTVTRPLPEDYSGFELDAIKGEPGLAEEILESQKTVITQEMLEDASGKLEEEQKDQLKAETKAEEAQESQTSQDDAIPTETETPALGGGGGGGATTTTPGSVTVTTEADLKKALADRMETVILSGEIALTEPDETSLFVPDGTTLMIGAGNTLNLGDTTLVVVGELDLQGRIESDGTAGVNVDGEASISSIQSDSTAIAASTEGALVTISGEGTISTEYRALSIYSGTVNMTGGLIFAKQAGGVYVNNGASFDISGGMVKVNTEYGVKCESDGIFTVSGLEDETTQIYIHNTTDPVVIPPDGYAITSSNVGTGTYLQSYHEFSTTIETADDWARVGSLLATGETITLSCPVTLDEAFVIPENTSLVIAGDGSIDVADYGVQVKGSLHLNGGSITSTEKGPLVYVESGIFTMDKGELLATGTRGIAVVVNDNAKFALNGGLIDASGYAIMCYATADLDMVILDSDEDTVVPTVRSVIRETVVNFQDDFKPNFGYSVETGNDGSYYLVKEPTSTIVNSGTWDDVVTALENYDKVTIEGEMAMTDDYTLQNYKHLVIAQDAVLVLGDNWLTMYESTVDISGTVSSDANGCIYVNAREAKLTVNAGGVVATTEQSAIIAPSGVLTLNEALVTTDNATAIVMGSFSTASSLASNNSTITAQSVNVVHYRDGEHLIAVEEDSASGKYKLLEYYSTGEDATEATMAYLFDHQDTVVVNGIVTLTENYTIPQGKALYVVNEGDIVTGTNRLIVEGRVELSEGSSITGAENGATSAVYVANTGRLAMTAGTISATQGTAMEVAGALSMMGGQISNSGVDYQALVFAPDAIFEIDALGKDIYAENGVIFAEDTSAVCTLPTGFDRKVKVEQDPGSQFYYLLFDESSSELLWSDVILALNTENTYTLTEPVTITSEYFLSESRELIVEDGGSLNATGDAGLTVSAGGTLTVKRGGSVNTSAANSIAVSSPNAVLNVEEGANITASAAATAAPIKLTDGTATILGIVSTDSIVNNSYEGSAIYAQGGKLILGSAGSQCNVLANTSTALDLRGGTHTIINANILGGTEGSGIHVTGDDTFVTMTDGVVSTESNTQAALDNAGYFNMDGGLIATKGADGEGDAVFNTGVFTISGGTVETENANAYAIKSNSDTVNMEGDLTTDGKKGIIIRSMGENVMYKGTDTFKGVKIDDLGDNYYYLTGDIM